MSPETQVAVLLAVFAVAAIVIGLVDGKGWRDWS